MESIIHKRLRRDSTNLHASFEDLVNKSLRDSASRPASPTTLQRQAAVVSTTPVNMPEDQDLLNLETEKSALDILKVIRNVESTGDQEMTTSEVVESNDQDDIEDTKC